MLENTRGNRRVLAVVAGANLVLALAVSAGALPRPGTTNRDRAVETVAAASVAGGSPTPATRPGAGPALETGPGPTTLPTTPTTVNPRTNVTSAPTSTPVAARTPRTSASAQTSGPAITVPPVTTPVLPVRVARRVPSAAEVQQAIATLPQYVRSLLSPSPAQVAQLGDKVCAMFDSGQSFAQVKATGLQMVTQVPLTTVLPGGADWVVRTVVTLYCPGHLSKLV